MISVEFERLIKQSISKSLALTMQERFPGEVLDVRESEVTINKKMTQAIILTISGHLFRMFVAIIFDKNAQLNNLIQNALSKSSTELDNSAFYDYLNEVGNVLCGSIKREFQRAIPSLGMSTPNLLNIESFNYIKELKIDGKTSYLVSQDELPLFYVNSYLGTYGNIEFDQVLSSEEDDVDSGELEFF